MRRRDERGTFWEILSLEDGAVDLSRLIGGPVLDTHRQQSLADVLGRVADAGIMDGEGWALVEISQRHRAIIDDITRGIVRQVSVGYQILEAAEGRAANGERTLVAKRWQPYELSFVPIGADPGATTRVLKGEPMNASADEAPAATRALVNQEIRAIVAIAGLERRIADELIDAGADADEARRRAFDELAKRQAPAVSSIHVGMSYDDPRQRAQWIGEAAFAVATRAPSMSEGARQYAYVRGPLDMARACLEAAGERTTMLSPASLVERAMKTSDFPLALSNAANLAVRQGYETAPRALLETAQERTAPDFKQQDVVTVSGANTLQLKAEGEAIAYGTVTEYGEKITVATYAIGEAWTREALINDSRGAFLDRPAQLGRAARETEMARAVTVLTANNGLGPTLSDNKALFHADHGNLATTAADPSVGLEYAVLALRKQTDLKGRRLNLTPRYLVVPPELEMIGQKIVGRIAPTTIAEVNPYSDLTLLVESRLTNATRWYLVGEGAPGLVIVRLEGRAGPQLDTWIDEETKDIKYSVLNDFGIGFIDYRAWFTNPGA